MENIFIITKWIHIISGGCALLTGLFAIIFRNKTKIHRPFGISYFWSMTIIFFTSVFMSIFHWSPFLLAVGFFTYYSCITGYRSLRLKQIHLEQKPLKFDWFLEVFFGTIHVLFLLFGIYSLSTNETTLGIISIVFAIFGLRGNWENYQRLSGKITLKKYWLIAHIGGMMGSYIGAVTAFTVNNYKIIPLPSIVLWLGPTAFLVPFIIYETRKYTRKFGKFSDDDR